MKLASVGDDLPENDRIRRKKHRKEKKASNVARVCLTVRLVGRESIGAKAWCLL